VHIIDGIAQGFAPPRGNDHPDDQKLGQVPRGPAGG
jgi:hypothetical protein